MRLPLQPPTPPGPEPSAGPTAEKASKPRKKQVFAQGTWEGSCLQNTGEEREEGEQEGRPRGGWGECLGGPTSFKASWGSSVVVVVDTVGPAP